MCYLSISLVLLLGLSLDSLIDALVHAVNDDREDETENSPDVLEVNPVIHESVVVFEAFLHALGCLCWRVHNGNKPADVNRKTNADEVVHLEEKTESTLLHLVDLREELNELVHALHTEVDEHEPIDVLHVSGSILILRGSCAVLLEEVHGLELEEEGHDGEADGDSH